MLLDLTEFFMVVGEGMQLTPSEKLLFFDQATRYAAEKPLCARVVAQTRDVHASLAQFEPMQARILHLAAYLGRAASFCGGRAAAAVG